MKSIFVLFLSFVHVVVVQTPDPYHSCSHQLFWEGVFIKILFSVSVVILSCFTHTSALGFLLIVPFSMENFHVPVQCHKIALERPKLLNDLTCMVVWVIVPAPSLSNPSKPFFNESTCSRSSPVDSTIRSNSGSCSPSATISMLSLVVLVISRETSSDWSSPTSDLSFAQLVKA